MDLSALIFVALALAWAVYLVPKALRHHEEDADARDVDGFSDRLRVLARRDAVSAKATTLVRPGRRAVDAEHAEQADPSEAGEGDAAEVEAVVVPEAAEPVRAYEADEAYEDHEPVEEVEPAAPTPAPRADRSDRSDRPAARPAERPALTPEERRRRRLRRESARRAAQRRRRVLTLLLVALVVVAASAGRGFIATGWIGVPAALVVGWLVLCRVMVRRERARRSAPVRRRRTSLADQAIADETAEDATPADIDEAVVEPDVDPAHTDAIPVITAVVPTVGWAPVRVPLPTYVAKAPASRTVRTIDLDATGVWSSGRNEADSALAREAQAREAQARQDDDAAEQRRASGS